MFEKKTIDSYSYQLGVIDCFNEMVHAGVKKLAMSHPCKTKEERDSYLEDCEKICSRYGTKLYVENTPFLTDLFPERLNKDTFHILFYRTDEVLQEYLSLKQKKEQLLHSGEYNDENRTEIAERFGGLLSYPEEAIARKIKETRAEKEMNK